MLLLMPCLSEAQSYKRSLRPDTCKCRLSLNSYTLHTFEICQEIPLNDRHSNSSGHPLGTLQLHQLNKDVVLN